MSNFQEPRIDFLFRRKHSMSPSSTVPSASSFRREYCSRKCVGSSSPAVGLLSWISFGRELFRHRWDLTLSQIATRVPSVPRQNRKSGGSSRTQGSPHHGSFAMKPLSRRFPRFLRAGVSRRGRFARPSTLQGFNPASSSRTARKAPCELAPGETDLEFQIRQIQPGRVNFFDSCFWTESCSNPGCSTRPTPSRPRRRARGRP